MLHLRQSSTICCVSPIADALHLALHLGLTASQLLNIILPLPPDHDLHDQGQPPAAAHSAQRSSPRVPPTTPAPAAFYATFRPAVNQALLFDIDRSVRHIMSALALRAGGLVAPAPSAAASAVSATAEAVLSGLVESLQRSREAAAVAAAAGGSKGAGGGGGVALPSQLDLHLASFVAACRRHLPLLRPLLHGQAGPDAPGGGYAATQGGLGAAAAAAAAPAAPVECGLLLLRVLRLLLGLDARALLRAEEGHEWRVDGSGGGGCLEFVVGAYCAMLGPTHRWDS